MKDNIKMLLIFLIALTMISNFWGCGSSGLKSIDAFDKLAPIEDLPEPTPDHNLVVKINNVADVGTSHQNWAELFINKKRIRLNKEVVGYHKDYHFHFRLKVGVYKVNAAYFAATDLKEKKYKITTSDGKVRIYPDRRTVLTIKLDKKLNGQLKSKKNYFKESYEPLPMNKNESIEFSTESQPESEQQAKGQVVPIKMINRRAKGTSTNKNRIMFRINTIPINAKIYIDSKYVGKSPLTTYVNPYTNHVIQLSLNGYQQKVVYVNQEDMKNKRSYQIKERLEAK